MIKRRLTVTIGIPSYNEGKTIREMLTSLLKQKEIGFEIKKIFVVSDGSKDNTVEEASLIENSKIKVINSKKNKGQIFRWNQIIRLTETDILVFLDADEFFQSELSLKKLIDEFNFSPNVALVGGNPYSVDDGSFLAKCQRLTKEAYTDLRYKIREGHNIFGCMGGMIAISKKLYKGLVIPSGIWANDSFIYLTCITRGYIFRNAKDAKIAHYLSYNLKSHIKRNERHAQSHYELKKYFGNLVDKEFKIPKILYFKAVLKQTLKYPVHSLFIFVVNSYSRYLARSHSN